MAHLSGGKCVDSFELRGVSCGRVVVLWRCGCVTKGGRFSWVINVKGWQVQRRFMRTCRSGRFLCSWSVVVDERMFLSGLFRVSSYCCTKMVVSR